MSGLLSAMMISSEGTQFSLDFLIVQIHHWHLHLAQCIAKPHLVLPRQFRRFAQRELADLEEPDCELKLQLLFDLAAWPAARHQQVIRILDGHFSLEITMPRVAAYLQACERRCSLLTLPGQCRWRLCLWAARAILRGGCNCRRKGVARGRD